MAVEEVEARGFDGLPDDGVQPKHRYGQVSIKPAQSLYPLWFVDVDKERDPARVRHRHKPAFVERDLQRSSVGNNDWHLDAGLRSRPSSTAIPSRARPRNATLNIRSPS